MRRSVTLLPLAAAIFAICVGVAIQFSVHTRVPTSGVNVDTETRDIAKQLACPVCQGISVADSPSQLAGEMRSLIRQKLQAGESRDAIVQYFVGAYGESILLDPPTKGFWLLIWLVPIAFFLLGLVAVGVTLRSWLAAPHCDDIDLGIDDCSPEETPMYAAELKRQLADRVERNSTEGSASTL